MTEDNQDDNAEDDQTDNRSKIKSILTKYIKDKNELNDVTTSLMNAIGMSRLIQPLII